MARRSDRARDARRAPASAVPLPPEPWSPPPAKECEDEEIVTPLPGGFRIVYRQRLYRNQLVEYAVILVKEDGVRHRELMCIDTKHGTVHRHNGPHDERPATVIQQITSQQDVQQSFSTSFDEVYDHYDSLQQQEES